jgi:hypothetical protein
MEPSKITVFDPGRLREPESAAERGRTAATRKTENRATVGVLIVFTS